MGPPQPVKERVGKYAAPRGLSSAPEDGAALRARVWVELLPSRDSPGSRSAADVAAEQRPAALGRGQAGVPLSAFLVSRAPC